MSTTPVNKATILANQLDVALALIAEQKVHIKKIDTEVVFLKSVIDKLMLCVETNGGNLFITRVEFEKMRNAPGAPKDYSYDDYVNDSIGDE